MQISELITPAQVRCGVEVTSKKRALEILSEMVTSSNPTLGSNSIFNCLLARERLGSTGLGDGVAIPHGRLASIERAVGAFMRLESGVDFDAQDHRPVDLVFGLLVPEKATDEHLQILSQLAELFSDPAFREQLRAARSDREAFELLVQPVHQS